MNRKKWYNMWLCYYIDKKYSDEWQLYAASTSYDGIIPYATEIMSEKMPVTIMEEYIESEE